MSATPTPVTRAWWRVPSETTTPNRSTPPSPASPVELHVQWFCSCYPESVWPGNQKELEAQACLVSIMEASNVGVRVRRMDTLAEVRAQCGYFYDTKNVQRSALRALINRVCLAVENKLHLVPWWTSRVWKWALEAMYEGRTHDDFEAERVQMCGDANVDSVYPLLPIDCGFGDGKEWRDVVHFIH